MVLNDGELFIVPKCIKHKPFADKECWILLLEHKQTKHSGDVNEELTVEENEWI